jgi:DNA-binding XRE family transcriptional regulator
MIKNKLKEIRNNAGLSRVELGVKSKISRIAIYNIEERQSIPNLNTALSIANTLNVSIYNIWDLSRMDEEVKLLTTKQARDYLKIKLESTFNTYRDKDFISKPSKTSNQGNFYTESQLDKAVPKINAYLKRVGIWGRVKEQKPIEKGNKLNLFNQFLTNSKRKIA